ncbi:gluconokinase [Neomicrococcus aestuarii]|uniref:Gluconokinase n=1 Tax=Neomicrococcus aestuarii TaxID=556325 RepID=A0A1L2ZPM4_9MICC|nr:gluconokinase [Neomicrococcus aestuarii]APF40962.1 gluconate kinase [Neomicrococcus aestuarii]
MDASEHLHIVVMGVSGSGKTSLAKLLSEKLGWPYAEADEFHPAENIAKMTAGHPLTDEDRWPWLRKMRDWMTAHTSDGSGSIVTCSALKHSYRDLLREADGRVVFIHVKAPSNVIEERLDHREGHFMPSSLLPSQFATLEELGDDEDGFNIDNNTTPADLADRSLVALGLTNGGEGTSR